MFAGKTTELIRRLTIASREELRAVAISPERDTRYGQGRLATHDGGSLDAVPIADAGTLVDAASDAEVVGIDEIHFFGSALVEPCRALLARGTRVIVAGVDLNHRGRPFPPFPELTAIADEVLHLTASCAICGGTAIHSQRMIESDEAIVVGGADLYQPRCGACFRPPT